MRAMLAIARFRYDDLSPDGAQVAESELGAALAELGRCAGFVAGSLGRAMDDQGLWVLETRWESVGTYRRALSSYQIKLTVVPLLSRALDEPSAYEVVIGEGATPLNESHPRGAVP
jgi:hypothetical protein